MNVDFKTAASSIIGQNITVWKLMVIIAIKVCPIDCLVDTLIDCFIGLMSLTESQLPAKSWTCLRIRCY